MSVFNQARKGICMICNEESLVVEVDFQDASKLKGPLCKGDFWEAIKKRAVKEAAPEQHEDKPSSKPKGQVA